MAAKVENIVCRFIGDFEVADNIVSNAKALSELDAANKGGVLNKLMVIQVGSIVEASLAQIIYRAQHYNKEGVPDITEEDRQAIASMTVEKFNNIIQTMKKYKILDGLGGDIYDQLHKLRKYRNKVHIQDDIDIAGTPRSETAAFSVQIVNWAFELTIRVLKHLNEKYPRPEHIEQYAREISLPQGS